MSDVVDQERITIPASWNLQFQHAAGRAASRFLIGLREQAQMQASPCPRCRKLRVPPRSFCEDCFVPTSDDWVSVGPEGVLRTFSITYADFPGYPKPPHVIAYVVPDGADTAICNFVRGIDLADPTAAAKRLAPGTRMTAVFHDDRQALITDFHWELVDGQTGGA
jgi:uncharacterized OB-fold protein